MASNKREWTTKAASNSNTIGVVRGSTGSGSVACQRGRYEYTQTTVGISRPILYF